MNWPTFLLGALAACVAIALTVVAWYFIALRRQTRPGSPARYETHLGTVTGSEFPLEDGTQPPSAEIADWADQKLAEAGFPAARVSRRFAPLRVTAFHVAFWLDEPLSWLRVGITFVSRDDRSIVDAWAPELTGEAAAHG